MSDQEKDDQGAQSAAAVEAAGNVQPGQLSHVAGVTDESTAEIMDAFAALRCAMTREQESVSISCVIAAVRADERQKHAWQPISSAPKDGTRVLAFWGKDPYNAHPGIFIALWFRGRWCDEGLHAFNFPGLTHWMPLPDPPVGSHGTSVLSEASGSAQSAAQKD